MSAEVIRFSVPKRPDSALFVATGDYKKLWSRKERSEARKDPATASQVAQLLSRIKNLRGENVDPEETLQLQAEDGHTIRVKDDAIEKVVDGSYTKVSGFMGMSIMHGHMRDDIRIGFNEASETSHAIITRNAAQSSFKSHIPREYLTGEMTASEEYMDTVLSTVLGAQVLGEE